MLQRNSSQKYLALIEYLIEFRAQITQTISFYEASFVNMNWYEHTFDHVVYFNIFFLLDWMKNNKRGDILFLL